MRILAFFLVLLLSLASYTHAQEIQTLFDGEVSHGGFGGPEIKFDNINGDLGVWVGGRGGWIINFDAVHALSIGGGGFGLTTEHEVPDPEYEEGGMNYYAMTGYGGFILEYTNNSYKLIHPTVSVLIGGGGLMIRDRDFEEIEDINTSPDQYFVFEPTATLELNITDFFRIGLGASYRITSGINRAGFTDEDYSGINGKLSFKFGKFL
ncbi:MAG: hypothetical protein WD267_09180 [Balneolales bacterium]